MTRQNEIVVADIGGTHARFAVADMTGARPVLGPAITLPTGAFAGLAQAWQAFAAQAGRALPHAAGIAIASPIGGEELKLTNNAWVIRPASLSSELGLETLALVNDFGAVAHAVAGLDDTWLRPVSGPAGPLPAQGVTSIVGPGTGLGVAMLVRDAQGVRVLETEGGHIAFAPVDALESRLLDHLRVLHGRVSAERIASGPGLAIWYEWLAAIEGCSVEKIEDKALWAAALEESDPLAGQALERFCMALGSVAGDIALAQGANAVVIAGGLGLKLADILPPSGFASRFVAKGRFRPRMATIPVRLLTYPEPGLFGAARAYAQQYG